MRFVRFSPVLVAVLIAGCAGSHGSSPLPATQVQASKGSGTATFVIKIPASTNTSASTMRSAQSVRPLYISPSTQSITIDITGPTDVDETANLTIDSSGCTSSLASIVCTLTVPGLQPGDYTATLTTYDQTGGTGNVLSAAQAVAFTIAAGASNTVSMTLSGVPVATLIASSGSLIQTNSSGGYDLLGQGARTFIAESLDADDNIIVGPGAPTFTIAQTSGTLSVTVPSATTSSAPNTFTITPPTSYTAGTATITATPTFTGQATNGCAQADANCGAASVTVDMGVLLYVLNDGNNTVTAYNDEGVRQTLTGTFPNMKESIAITSDPSNGFIYVANDIAPYTITAYNQEGVQQTLTGNFSSQLGPQVEQEGLEYDPGDGDLYVATINEDPDEPVTYDVTAYNAEGVQQTLTGTFPSLYSPGSIAYDSNNGYLYIANGQVDGEGVLAYNDEGVEQTLTDPIPLGDVYAVTFDSGHDWLWITTGGPLDEVYAYSGEGVQEGYFTPIVGDESLGIAYDPSNGAIYVGANNNTITAWAIVSNIVTQQTLTGSFSNLDGPSQITVMP